MAELSENTKLEIIKLLDFDGCDGEDVQDILIRSGWEDQMLHQLMRCGSIETVKYLYEERLELEKELNVPRIKQLDQLIRVLDNTISNLHDEIEASTKTDISLYFNGMILELEERRDGLVNEINELQK